MEAWKGAGKDVYMPFQITSYPRTLRGTVRKEDDHRKVKRRDRLERKAREKEGRKEEIRRYRNLQEMEVKDKLDKLARVTGEQCAVSGEQYAVSGEQYAVSGEQYAVSGEQYAVSGEQYAVSGEQYAVSGEQYAVSGEQYAVSGELLILPPHRESCGVFWFKC